MVTYDVIEELQKAGLYKVCLQNGIISTSINFKKYVYEVFLQNKQKTKTKTQAVSNTAEDVGKSEVYVWKVIAKMES